MKFESDEHYSERERDVLLRFRGYLFKAHSGHVKRNLSPRIVHRYTNAVAQLIKQRCITLEDNMWHIPTHEYVISHKNSEHNNSYSAARAFFESFLKNCNVPWKYEAQFGGGGLSAKEALLYDDNNNNPMGNISVVRSSQKRSRSVMLDDKESTLCSPNASTESDKTNLLSPRCDVTEEELRAFSEYLFVMGTSTAGKPLAESTMRRYVLYAKYRSLQDTDQVASRAMAHWDRFKKWQGTDRVSISGCSPQHHTHARDECTDEEHARGWVHPQSDQMGVGGSTECLASDQFLHEEYIAPMVQQLGMDMLAQHEYHSIPLSVNG